MEKNIRNKGITLIALVVTIIVLLIITGITISELVSNDSIIVKTQKAKEENLKNQIFEEMKLKIYQIHIFLKLRIKLLKLNLLIME